VQSVAIAGCLLSSNGLKSKANSRSVNKFRSTSSIKVPSYRASTTGMVNCSTNASQPSIKFGGGYDVND